MRIQSDDYGETQFRFRILSRLREVGEGINFMGVAELLMWIQAGLFSDAMDSYLLLFFLALSHALGIPIAIHNLRKSDDILRCVPDVPKDRQPKVINLSDYLKSKKAA